jgi:hypothetical protein
MWWGEKNRKCHYASLEAYHVRNSKYFLYDILICPNNRKDQKMKIRTRFGLKCEDALHTQVEWMSTHLKLD